MPRSAAEHVAYIKDLLSVGVLTYDEARAQLATTVAPWNNQYIIYQDNGNHIPVTNVKIDWNPTWQMSSSVSSRLGVYPVPEDELTWLKRRVNEVCTW